jgi:hypothetical protein
MALPCNAAVCTPGLLLSSSQMMPVRYAVSDHVWAGYPCRAGHNGLAGAIFSFIIVKSAPVTKCMFDQLLVRAHRFAVT